MMPPLCRVEGGEIYCFEFEKDSPQIYFTNHLSIGLRKQVSPNRFRTTQRKIGAYQPEDKNSIHNPPVNMVIDWSREVYDRRDVSIKHFFKHALGFETNNETDYLRACFIDTGIIKVKNARFHEK